MNWSMDHVGHLVRRFVGSVSPREPNPADTAWVDAQLLDAESQLWHRMSVADRRHTIAVARRFEALGQWSREEVAGALLHDVGKLDAGLGTLARVAATIVGPRTTRFRRYHDHERIGAELLAMAGSSHITIELVLGRGRAARALANADNI
jgi:predicted HD phosphohydrolase